MFDNAYILMYNVSGGYNHDKYAKNKISVDIF
jgi:hypothetical protein